MTRKIIKEIIKEKYFLICDECKKKVTSKNGRWLPESWYSVSRLFMTFSKDNSMNKMSKKN